MMRFSEAALRIQASGGPKAIPLSQEVRRPLRAWLVGKLWKRAIWPRESGGEAF